MPRTPVQATFERRRGESWHGGGPGYSLGPVASPWIMQNRGFLEHVISPAGIGVDIGTFEGRHLPLLRTILGPQGRLIGTDIHSDRFAGISCESIAELITASLDRTLPTAIDCDGVADIAICHRVLHHLADETAVEQAIAGLAGLLRPGGRILLAVRELDSREKSERSDTPNPDGTRRTDLYFGRDAFVRIVEPHFEIVLEASIHESEFYIRDEPVEVMTRYLAMGLQRRRAETPGTRRARARARTRR